KAGREDRIVSAKRMTNGAEPALFDKRQRFEKIQAPNIVPNCFHRPALITERFKVGLVVRHKRISRSQHDESSCRKFMSIGRIILAQGFYDDAMAVFYICRMKRQDRCPLPMLLQTNFRNQ